MAKKKTTEIPTEPIVEPAAETQPIKKSRSIFKNEAERTSEPEIIPTSLSDEQTLTESEPTRRKHGSWVWIGILIMLVIVAIGTGIGYKMAIDIRMREGLNQRLIVATTQFELAINDEKNGNLDVARQRLEYILEIYPTYPGLDKKLTDVMLAIALTQGPSQLTTPAPNETASTSVTVVPTKDTKNLSILLNQAQAQLSGKDWPGLLATVLSMRDLDPFFESMKVDGLYYMALRNNGIAKIKEGSLEVGIFYFSLAEQMAPIDNEADGYRQWAKMYSNAGSYWQSNMQMAATLFAELYPLVPNLVDASGITVRTRYAKALEGYGDYLQQTYLWCDAVPQYESSIGVIPSDALSAKLTQARDYCSNPPATPTPVITPTPTLDPSIPTPIPPPG
jgi:tetratricopeptide (TPR) repeat protein